MPGTFFLVTFFWICYNELEVRRVCGTSVSWSYE